MALDTMLDMEEVRRVTGLSRSHIYASMRAGTFPVAIKLAGKAIRWPESEIREWLESKPRAMGTVGQDADQQAA